MKRNVSYILFIMIFLTVLSSCKKNELLDFKTVYGEAKINEQTFYQYTKIGEGVSNKYWFLPLGLDNNFIVKDRVCYLQMFLRDYEETETENFYLILVGIYADENFPVIGKDYKFVVQEQINLGNIYNSFYWSGELKNFYSNNPEFEAYGIAGLSIPPNHDRFIPLEGTIVFSQETKESEYSILYTFESNNKFSVDPYHIIGEFRGKLKIVN